MSWHSLPFSFLRLHKWKIILEIGYINNKLTKKGKLCLQQRKFVDLHFLCVASSAFLLWIITTYNRCSLAGRALTHSFALCRTAVQGSPREQASRQRNPRSHLAPQLTQPNHSYSPYAVVVNNNNNNGCMLSRL